VRIVNGQKLVNSRPLLAGGDAEWADAYLVLSSFPESYITRHALALFLPT